MLTFWRFAIVTLAGIAPASYLLAHFCSEMGTGESNRILFSVLALRGLTLIPIGAKLYRYWRVRRQVAVDANAD